MRLVFLALLVANIAFFGWARWVDRPPKIVAGNARESSVPPLQLVPGSATATPAAANAQMQATPAEAPVASATPEGAASAAAAVTPTAPASAPAPSVTTATGTPLRCRTLGPFEEATAANAVATRLRSRGFSPRDRSAETANPNVYWVYIGELTSEMQRRAIQTLNAAGIHDAASMSQPEQSDRVSVGVFADQAHAVKRAEQVRTLGFKPTLGMRQRTVTAHWLDFDLKAGDPDPPSAELIGGSNRSTPGLGPVKIIDCPASAGSG